jgi:hypothetical protein
MKTGLQMSTMMVLLLSLFLLCGIFGAVSPVSGSNGRTHDVVRGDTLWDVSQQYLSNPFFWPKVWQYNPHVENPHLIYPGEQIRIPSPEELARMGARGLPAALQKGSVIEGSIAYVGGFLIERDLFESSGFVLPKGEDLGEGVVLSSWEEKIYLTDRDLVHINLGSRNGVKTGDLFEVIHLGDEVIHPLNKLKIGKQALIRGILKVISVDEKLATARIIKAYHAVNVGDAIRPYYQKPLIGSRDLNREDKSIQGVIVQNTLGKSNLAVRDTVYIDVGSDDSVIPGDRFVIYRSGLPKQVSRDDAIQSGIDRFPADIMGELVVLKTAKNTATAVVTEELYEITPGDRIKYSPRSLPPIKKYDMN